MLSHYWPQKYFERGMVTPEIYIRIFSSTFNVYHYLYWFQNHGIFFQSYEIPIIKARGHCRNSLKFAKQGVEEVQKMLKKGENFSWEAENIQS